MNRFREWILDHIGYYDEGYVKGKLSKKVISKKELTRIKKESKIEKVEKVKVSKVQLPEREVQEDYEIDNVLMELKPEIPSPKKYKIRQLYSQEQRLLYQFRYLNYSEKSFDLLRHALLNRLDLPDRFVRFKNYLKLDKDRLYFKDMPILRPHEIQKMCREMYFDPLKPFSPDKIYREISNKGANLSRSKVRNAVQSIEQYQLRREIRRPKKVEANFIVTSSNTIVCDMFFMNNYKFFNCIEAFSGYIKTYYVNSSHAELIKTCVMDFMKEIATFGHLINRLICDKGTENQKLKNIDGLKVVFTQTAQPMHLAEFYNSLVAKRINLYLDLDFEPSEILDLVLKGLNDRKRTNRSHFTPIEILQMTKQYQKLIAKDIVYKVPEEHYNLKKIHVGSFVRILQVSRKDQRVRPMSYKGYKKKYSNDVYQVETISRVGGTINVFKYKINGRFYFRNELLLIPEYIDKKIPIITRNEIKEPLFDDDDSSGMYVPSDVPSDEDD